LLFLLLNAALFFWIRDDPPQLRPDREPQRLDRQISPDAIQVLPDLPTASGAARASGSSGGTTVEPAGAPAAGAASAAASGAAGASSAVATKVGEDSVDCAESGPLNDTELAALRKTLAKAGVQPEAIVERKQQPTNTWLVYIGRFSDSEAWQAKADELRRLNIKFDRVTQPPSLSPGLSLGSYASASEASVHLDDLSKHGVKTARVVAGSASSVARLQVRSAAPGWRLAAGTQHFGACPAQPA
jgi:hypothetical protein